MADEPDFTDKYNTKLSENDEKSFSEWAQANNRMGDLSNYDMRGWWKKNGKQDGRGHMTDEFKKPNHPTFSDESIYHGEDGYKGGKWSGDDKTGYTFKPSKWNLENLPEDQMRAYFDKVEPGSTLDIAPPPKTDADRMLSRYGAQD